MSKPIFVLSAILIFSSLSAAPINHAIGSAIVIDSKTEKTLFSRLGQVSLTPASTLKLITTAAALHILGPDAYFTTFLEYDGLLDEEGQLHGNVYIRGGGDPCLGSGRAQGSLPWKQQLTVWAQALQEAGIQSIEGCIIGDTSAWPTLRAVPSWAFEDLGSAYGAAPCALSFHENSYELQFASGTAIGSKAEIAQVEPPISSLKLMSEVTIGPADSGDGTWIYGSELSSQQLILGTVPAQESLFVVRGAINDPERVVASLFKTHLEEAGIPVLSTPLPHLAPRTHVYTTKSPSVKDIVYWTNQKSINLYAEHLLRHMGKGSAKEGVLVVENFLQSLGIDTEGFYMVDGSGLSRKNCVTSHQLATLLVKMKNSPHFDAFFASLPEKEKGIRAKTGYMSLINNCAGYEGDKAFAILINHCPDTKAMKEAVSRFLSQLTQGKLETPKSLTEH